MPQATNTHTRNPSDVAAVFAVIGAALSDLSSALPIRSERRGVLLASACNGAIASQLAIDALDKCVAGLSPYDARHAAVHAAAERLTRRREEQVSTVCTIPAEGREGFQAKAGLLCSLVERGDTDTAVGSPALQVAASLADDLLAFGAWGAGV